MAVRIVTTGFKTGNFGKRYCNRIWQVKDRMGSARVLRTMSFGLCILKNVPHGGGYAAFVAAAAVSSRTETEYDPTYILFRSENIRETPKKYSNEGQVRSLEENTHAVPVCKLT